MVTTRLATRLERLEESLTPGARVWHVCRRDGETDEATFVRHGVRPEPADLVVMHRWGLCRACQARTLAPASGA